MKDLAESPQTSDICLLLRAHGEQRWLIYEVVPVVRQLEQRDSLLDEELGAALAYLEVLQVEARRLAAETDAAYAELEAPAAGGDLSLHEKARRYHVAVWRLRRALDRRVGQLLAPAEHVPAERTAASNGAALAGSDGSGCGPILDRYASS